MQIDRALPSFSLQEQTTFFKDRKRKSEKSESENVVTKQFEWEKLAKVFVVSFKVIANFKHLSPTPIFVCRHCMCSCSTFEA